MLKVMIADDEPIVRRALVTLIDWEKLDCEIVYVASTGKEIIDNLMNVNPDIIITDIRMPELSGIEVAKYIFEEKLPIKIILLTAYADFSYAQSAVKYNVLDYVTKTGAFDGIDAAIEKAKEIIAKESRDYLKESNDVAKVSFFKGIFDESLYDTVDIQRMSKELQINLNNYLILIFHFKQNEDNDKQTKAQGSLTNFFSMAFKEEKSQIISINRNKFIIILDQVEIDYKENINKKCIDIIDMMDNFMNLGVYIGISGLHIEVLRLKQAFDEATMALNSNFLCEENKINFFSPAKITKELYLKEIDSCVDEICHEIKRGDKDKAINHFLKMLELQKNNGSSANTIMSSGILIENQCQKFLSEYNTTLLDITSFHKNITQLIYNSFHVGEYSDILIKVISKTADYIKISVNKRNQIIYDCERFIDEYYEKYITVADIADKIGVSGSYLSRIFKEKTGNTIIYTINHKKIEKAKEYLVNTDMKIYEIADILGFDNTTYFSHFFKKHTGISPKDYKIK